MIAANFSEFRAELKRFLDSVEDDNETLIIKRKTGKRDCDDFFRGIQLDNGNITFVKL
jgi:hypothetical protein